MAAARATAATGAAVRLSSASAGAGGGSEAERAMHAALAAQLEAVHVKVTDVSGGCGSMFDVEVVSPQFVGQTRVKQHRMVNEVRIDG
jgi:stress-induced morphogen